MTYELKPTDKSLSLLFVGSTAALVVAASIGNSVLLAFAGGILMLKIIHDVIKQ